MNGGQSCQARFLVQYFKIISKISVCSSHNSILWFQIILLFLFLYFQYVFSRFSIFDMCSYVYFLSIFIFILFILVLVLLILQLALILFQATFLISFIIYQIFILFRLLKVFNSSGFI